MINCLYDNFKYMCQTGSIWIISDTHFDDPDSKLMDKNWISSQDQVDIINKYVYKNDWFICLGDTGNLEWFKKIKCPNKCLVKGNHDDQRKALYYDYFDVVFDGAVFIAPKILLSHEPIGVPFALNIHGHDHNNVEHYKDNCKYLNLAANICNYTPVNLGKLIKQGILADIPNIHRIVIDNATKRKSQKSKQ